MMKQKEENTSLAFIIFCFWAFILICRPQNFIPALVPFRPALLSTALMVLFYCIYSKEISGPKLFKEKQVKHYFYLVFIFIMSIPTALHVRVSFESIFPDYVVTFLFFIFFYKLVNTTERLEKILLTVCLGSGLYFLSAVNSGIGSGGRLYFSTTFDPNDLAYFALVFLPLNLFFIERTHQIWKRIFCSSFIVGGILLIFLSQSRGGLISFVFAMLILLFWTQQASRLLKIIVLTSMLVVLAFAPINYERFSTLLNIEEDYNLHSETGRMTLWGIGIRAMLENPLTGVGINNFVRAVAQDRTERGLEVVRWQVAHNSLVQIGAETGVIGLSLYSFLSLNVIRIFHNVRKYSHSLRLRKISELLMVGFLGMFAASLFLSQAYSLYWVFYVVLSAALSQMLIKEQKQRLSMESA